MKLTDSTKEQICAGYLQWLEKIAPKDIVNDNHNALLIGNWVEENRGGEYNFANFTSAIADFHVNNRLHKLTVLETEAQKAERLAAEKKAKDNAAQIATVQSWVNNHCPKGLLTSTGEPYAGDIDRIIEFVRTNYNLRFSIEALNAAVMVLGPVLTWMVPEGSSDRQIRNLPEKKRQISERMALEAGLKKPIIDNPHKNDGVFNDPNQKMKEFIRKSLGKADPDLTAADQISVTNRMGRTDHAFTASLREMFVYHPDGKTVNGKATLALRKQKADEYERQRNRV
jgi:hypothetical protein